MKHLLTVLVLTVLASSSFAQDAATKEMDAKKNWQASKIEKLLTPVTLTSEQQASFAEATKKLSADLSMMKENGLTSKITKMREEKRKEGRKSGLKGKELAAHVVDGFSAEEAELIQKYDKAIKTFEKTVAGMLTDEQLSALPEKSQKKMKMVMREKGGKGGKGKKKKKMKADADADAE